MAGSRPLVAQKPRGRSRIANGTALLPSVDGRSVWARILRDTLAALTAHCGGAEALSETARLLVRRVAVLECELLFIEDRFAATRAAGDEPDPADVEAYGRLADRQRRLAEPLGWQRLPRDVTPTLSQYLDKQNDGARNVVDLEAAE